MPFDGPLGVTIPPSEDGTMPGIFFVNVRRPHKRWVDLVLKSRIRARFLSLRRLRLCSANHRACYFSNLACDWLNIVWACSEQKNRKRDQGWTTSPSQYAVYGSAFFRGIKHLDAPFRRPKFWDQSQTEISKYVLICVWNKARLSNVIKSDPKSLNVLTIFPYQRENLCIVIMFVSTSFSATITIQWNR